MKALLLAAGYATRLYPLTLDKPKPLLSVGKRPIIDYIIEKIKKIKAIDEIFVVTNHKFYKHFKIWARQNKISHQRLIVIDDATTSNDDRLGSVGDIDFVIENQRVKDDLLVIGADNIFDAELSDFIKFSVLKKDSNSAGLYDLTDKKLASNYGVVCIDKDNKVTDFQEKPHQPKSTLISTCIYYFPLVKLNLFKKYMNTYTCGIDQAGSKDAAGNYIKWLKETDSVYGYVLSGKWYDIGDMESYKEADNYFKK